MTRGARIAPTRPQVELELTPVLRSTVGNTSAEYTYTMPKEADMQNRESVVSSSTGQSRSYTPAQGHPSTTQSRTGNLISEDSLAQTVDYFNLREAHENICGLVSSICYLSHGWGSFWPLRGFPRRPRYAGAVLGKTVPGSFLYISCEVQV